MKQALAVAGDWVKDKLGIQSKKEDQKQKSEGMDKTPSPAEATRSLGPLVKEEPVKSCRVNAFASDSVIKSVTEGGINLIKST